MAKKRFNAEKEVGTIPNKYNSVKQVRKIREKLSKEEIDLNEINNFGI